MHLNILFIIQTMCNASYYVVAYNSAISYLRLDSLFRVINDWVWIKMLTDIIKSASSLKPSVSCPGAEWKRYVYWEKQNGQETVEVTTVLCYLIEKRFAKFKHNVFHRFELRSEQNRRRRPTTATIK